MRGVCCYVLPIASPVSSHLHYDRRSAVNLLCNIYGTAIRGYPWTPCLLIDTSLGGESILSGISFLLIYRWLHLYSSRFAVECLPSSRRAYFQDGCNLNVEFLYGCSPQPTVLQAFQTLRCSPKISSIL